MEKITIQCPGCTTLIVADTEQVNKIACREIACPLCGVRLPLGNAPASVPSAGGIRHAADMFKIDCAACGATLNVSRDAYKNLAGKSINCLKCNAEIKISQDGTVLNPPLAPAAAAPAVAIASDSAALPPPPTVAARQAAGPRLTPVNKKCFTCGKVLEAGEEALCHVCKTTQQADRVSMTVPVEGRLGPKITKLKMRDEAPPAVQKCVKCGSEFPEQVTVCPACGIDQATGKKSKQQKKVMAVWPQPGASGPRMPGGKAIAKMAHFLLKVVIMIIVGIAIYYSYKYITNQLDIAKLPPKD